jgi:NADPH2:quinone reductase
MKALLCTKIGTPDDLVLADLPDPMPGRGEVCVRVHSVSLNFFDTLIIANKYQVKPALPFSPGAEFAGVVERVGSGVGACAPGDRVMAYCRFGAAREQVVVPEQQVIRMPEGLDFDRAAGLCVTYGTSLYALDNRAHLKAGETLAVLGASGGVGTAAVEIGKLLGARVIACASSPDKLDFARQHGADETIDYSKEDLKLRLRELTGDRGVDVIYDPVGGAYSEAALRSMNWEGRFLVVGFAAGDIPRMPLNLVLLKSCDIRGVAWGAWTDRDPAGHRANAERLLAWEMKGKLSTHIHAVYPLAETADALKAIARREVKGKVILRI